MLSNNDFISYIYFNINICKESLNNNYNNIKRETTQTYTIYF